MTTQLYTVDEAADRLRIGRVKLYKLMKEGAIESVKLGKHRRISEDALSAFIGGLTRSTL